MSSDALFAKPRVLCFDKPRWDGPLDFDDKPSWIHASMEAILHRFEKQGLYLQPMEQDHIQAARALFPRANGWAPKSPPDVLAVIRTIRFGHPMVVLDSRGELAGYLLQDFLGDDQKTSFGWDMCLLPQYRGQGLARALMRYALLQAMRLGSKVRRTFASSKAPPVLMNALNHLGCIAEDFYPSQSGQETPRLALCIPLQPEAMLCQVDPTRLNRFTSAAQKNVDYQLIYCSDHDAISEIYMQKTFKIAAYIPGHAGSEPTFLALSNKVLQIR